MPALANVHLVKGTASRNYSWVFRNSTIIAIQQHDCSRPCALGSSKAQLDSKMAQLLAFDRHVVAEQSLAQAVHDAITNGSPASCVALLIAVGRDGVANELMRDIAEDPCVGARPVYRFCPRTQKP
jgi:hypothetical protein